MSKHKMEENIFPNQEKIIPSIRDNLINIFYKPVYPDFLYRYPFWHVTAKKKSIKVNFSMLMALSSEGAINLFRVNYMFTSNVYKLNFFTVTVYNKS